MCYTYADCLAEIRAGNDVDYEGVTGSGSYTPGGVNDVTQAYSPLNADGSFGDAVVIDPARALEVIDLIAVEADCSSGECEW